MNLSRLFKALLHVKTDSTGWSFFILGNIAESDVLEGAQLYPIKPCFLRWGEKD